MNTEKLTVHPNGDDFEIIVEHDQTGSTYGITLSKSAYEQLRLHFVSDCLIDPDVIAVEAEEAAKNLTPCSDYRTGYTVGYIDGANRKGSK
jgi:hypothetical protein